MNHALECLRCGRTVAVPGAMACTHCGGSLRLTYDLEQIGHRYDRARLPAGEGVWRYGFLLPSFAPGLPVTLGEGATPLVQSRRFAKELGLDSLYFKREDQNPTSSFKDRQMTVGATVAEQLGESRLTLESSGNAGASAAAYGARAGFDVTVFVGEKLPLTKVAQISKYGGRVAVLRGMNDGPAEYYRSMMHLRDVARRHGWWHVGPARSLNPYAVEGSKTIAFEICEQLDWTAPDSVVVPVGGGALCGAIWKGFVELAALGWIDSLPRMIGVEESGRGVPAEASDRVLEALASGSDVPEEFSSCSFVPLDGGWTWEAIERSGGTKLMVSRAEMEESVDFLAGLEGILAEPLATRAIAGLRKAVRDGAIAEHETTVCLVTGSGLKELAVSDELVGGVSVVDDPEGLLGQE